MSLPNSRCQLSEFRNKTMTEEKEDKEERRWRENEGVSARIIMPSFLML